LNTLPLVEKPEGILAFDFDGTLHWPDHRPPVDRRLLEWIEFLRERHGMIWGICTGRSLMHLVEGLSTGFPFLPDFAVTREREIFFPGRFGRFVPDDDWNKACEKAHKRVFKKMRKELAAIRKYVEEVAGGKWVQVEGDLAGVVLSREESMGGLLEEIERVCGDSSELAHERNGIYLRFSHADYGKGAALKEIARRCQVEPDSVVAAGDNFNDLTMFHPAITRWPICPGNAVFEVKERVTELDGVVGESLASSGLVEAMEELFLPGGKVESATRSS
jgi:HAD superfamily hydrolase (TIGR01484 family)